MAVLPPARTVVFGPVGRHFIQLWKGFVVDMPAPAAFSLDDVVRVALMHNTSDIHMHDGRPTYFRVDGLLTQAGKKPLPEGWLATHVLQNLSGKLRDKFSKEGNVEAGLRSNGYRLRASLGQSESGMFGVFRLLPPTLPLPSEVGIPEAAVSLMHKSQGILLISGASGAGKSTTCASLLAGMSETRKGMHILTLEDPIEYILPTGDNSVTQREMYTHYQDFTLGLRMGVRQDPDIIFIGELRDQSSATAAISAAGSGHLVLATIHSYDAVSAVDSLLWLAGVEDKPQVRSQIAHVLLGVLSQRLVRLKGGKRQAAFELLINTEGVAKLIAKPGGLAELSHEMETGVRSGHIQLEETLAKLVVSGQITDDVAMAAASDLRALRSQITHARTTANRQ